MNTPRIKRYSWEDALIDAQTAGNISNGALLVALKISKAINWKPSNGRCPGLYWKNEDALKAVGCGRSTYFKHRGELFEAGFLTEHKGNLLPVLPAESTVETNQSTVETRKSTVETDQSTLETGKSTGEHPFSVDILSEDTLSEDTLSEDTLSEDHSEGPVADAPALASLDRSEGLPLSTTSINRNSNEEEGFSYQLENEGLPLSNRLRESPGPAPEPRTDQECRAAAKAEDILYYYERYMDVTNMKPKTALRMARKKVNW